MIIKKIKKIPVYLRHPEKIIVFINSYSIGRLFSDSFFLKCLYKASVGKKLNLRHPHTFNEKLQWLKLHNKNPEYTDMVDKYEAKRIIEKTLGNEYVVRTLGVWDKYEDIEFNKLPEQFVLKCTHCGGVIICKNKEDFDFQKAEEKINSLLKKNYFWHAREWPYKNIKPRIIAEEYIENSEEAFKDNSLIVYKFFCFDGVPEIIQVIQNDKRSDESIDYFDTEWNLLKLRQNFPNSEVHLDKPKRFEEMLKLSSKLSKNIPFLRVDWYESNEKLLFSEFTFYSDAGTAAFEPEEWDYKLGKMIDLSKVKNSNGKH